MRGLTIFATGKVGGGGGVIQLTPAQAVSWNSHLVAYEDLTMDKTPLMPSETKFPSGERQIQNAQLFSEFHLQQNTGMWVICTPSSFPFEELIHQLRHDFPHIYHKLLVQLIIKINLIKRRVINMHLGSKPCSSIPAVTNGDFFMDKKCFITFLPPQKTKHFSLLLLVAVTCYAFSFLTPDNH